MVHVEKEKDVIDGKAGLQIDPLDDKTKIALHRKTKKKNIRSMEMEMKMDFVCETNLYKCKLVY